MSVAKRNDGRFVVKYKDIEGHWKQRSFRSEVEARQFDADCQYDNFENSRLTLLEAVLVFLKNTQHIEKKVAQYEYLVCGHDRKDGTHREGPAEFLADRFVDTLTRRDLEMVRENCRNYNLALTTINSYTGRLKAAMNWCAEEGLIVENPWGKFKQLRGAHHKAMQGTLEEFQRLYPVLPPWLQWASRTAIALCLRPGVSELFSLKWSAFDWKTKTVTMYMSKTDSTKRVYMPDAYIEEAWQRYQADIAQGQMLVCRNRKGHPVGSGMYRSAWRSACKKAGVDMPMYALRHIAASEMLAGGIDLAAVAAQLGHKNLTTTGAFYTHALDSAQRRAAQTLPICTSMVQDGAVLGW